MAEGSTLKDCLSDLNVGDTFRNLEEGGHYVVEEAAYFGVNGKRVPVNMRVKHSHMRYCCIPTVDKCWLLVDKHLDDPTR
ncbi:MAG: hypothetical protein WC796_02780 [Candidatus Pacearchaeota archaeon]|jgi:hypothetical protein